MALALGQIRLNNLFYLARGQLGSTPSPVLAGRGRLFLYYLLDLFLQQPPWIIPPRGVLEPLSRFSVVVLFRWLFGIDLDGLSPHIDILSQVYDLLGIVSELVLIELPIFKIDVAESFLEFHPIKQRFPL